MGAFGAIHIGAELGITSVAFSPQASLDPQYNIGASWRPVYEKTLHDFVCFKSNILEGKCSESQIYLFYDFNNALDRKYAKAIIEKCNKCISFNITWGGHACSGTVNHYYRIKNIILEILSGTFNPRSFRKKYFSLYDPLANIKFNGFKYFKYLCKLISDQEFYILLNIMNGNSYRELLVKVLRNIEKHYPDKIYEIIPIITDNKASVLYAESPEEARLFQTNLLDRIEICSLFYFNRKRYARVAELWENKNRDAG